MPLEVPTEPLLTASSGSVGDVVFSRNQHGPYTRARTTPTDPASTAQLAVRAALSQCVTAWNATLTATERRGWDAFALAVRTRGRLGRSTNAGGLGMFVRANVPRIQALVGVAPRVDQPPTQLRTPWMDHLTTAILNIVDDTVLAYVPPFQNWLNQLNGALLFYASRPQPLTVNYFRGPYRYAAKIVGQPLGPSYSPFTIPLPFPAALNDRVFIRARQTRADARLGPSVYLQADHLPQVAPTPISAKFIPPIDRRVEVTFTEIIRPEPHSIANWTVTFGGRDWNVVSVADDFHPSGLLTLRFSGFIPTIQPNRVVFTPPPNDVNGINTGLPVAPFTIPLTL